MRKHHSSVIGDYSRHRIVEDSSAIRDIDYSSTGDRFAEDMQLLLEGIVLSADEQKLRQARRFAVEGITQPSDEEDDSTDGVVLLISHTDYSTCRTPKGEIRQ